MLILKIKNFYFNIFLNKKYFKSPSLLSQYQTRFGSVVVVVFQNVFCAEIHQMIFFLFF
jgi:hypothetical protein